MALSIDWSSSVISVPQAYLTFISTGLYELDVDAFRLDLKDIEDSEEGMPFPDTHRHNTEVVLSGVTYARTFEILSPYTVTFEDTGTPYTVRCVGANHNIADVKNVNNVSLIIGNSAGLITVATGGSTGPSAGDIAAAVLSAAVEGIYTMSDILKILAAVAAGKTNITDLGGGNAHVEFDHIDESGACVEAEMTGSERTDVTLTP